MGLFDFILGRRSSGDDPALEERKTYGDLYANGAGRVNRDLDDDSGEEIEETDHAADKKASRLQDDLQGIERRARDLHIYDNQVRKKIGKVESSIDRVRDAENPHVMSERNSKLRSGLRKSYGKIKQENDKHLEKLRQSGATDRQIKTEELKLKKIREDMSSMYRRSGGSGMLK